MATSGLGQLLVKEGLLTETDRILIRTASGTQGAAFARGVIAIGLLDEEELAAFLAEKTKWRVANKDLARESRKDAWGAIDRLLVERLEVMPLRLEGDTLLVAMVDPLDRDTIEQLRFFTGCRIRPVIATLSQIRTGLAKLLSDFKPAKSHLEDFLENHALSASQKIRLKELGKGAGATLAALSSRGAGTATGHKGSQEADKTKSQVEKPTSHAAGSSAARPIGAAAHRASSNDLKFDDLPLSSGGSAAPRPVDGADGDDELLGGLDSGPSGGADSGLESGLESDLDFDPDDDTMDQEVGQRGSPKTPSAAKGVSEEDTLIFDADEQELGDAPSTRSDTQNSAISLEEDQFTGSSSGLLDDDLLGGSQLEEADAKPDADLSFVDDIPDAAPSLDQEPDLDTEAVQEIADMDDSTDLDETHTASKDASSRPANDTPASVSDDDLFDVGALASDFNTIEDSIASSDTPPPASTILAKPAPKKTAVTSVPMADGPDTEDDLLGDAVPFDGSEDPLLADTPPQEDMMTATSDTIDADDTLLDPLDELGIGAEETSPNIPFLNRFMMTMSLMTDPKIAMDKAVPVLIEAGLTRGIVINLTQGQSQAVVGWGISGEIIERNGQILARFNEPQGQKWLEAAPRELTTVDTKALSGAMAHYAPWVAGGQRQVLSLLAPSSDPARIVAFVTAWEHKGAIDLSLQNMVADIFRKIALHL